MNGKDECPEFVALLRVCAKKKDLCRGTRLHEEILRRGMSENCSDPLIMMYAKCGALAKAIELFEVHSSRDVFTWTALMAGCAQKDLDQDVLNYYELMCCEGLFPIAMTYSCILKACGGMCALKKGEEIHDEIAKRGLLGNNVLLSNALITMYAKCGSLVKAQEVLEEIPMRDVVSWTALIAGYAEHGDGEQALECLHQMQHEGLSPDVVTYSSILKACGSMKAADKGERVHEEIARRGFTGNNIVLGTALVDMYAKCGALAKAQQVLNEFPNPNVISWTALIAGYVEHGKGEEALNCFEKMQREGLVPNVVTFACIFKACGRIGATEKGEKLHEKVSKQGLLEKNIVLCTALIDMYAKCGALARARQVLDEFPEREVTSWNALITGYVEHGELEEALDCFERMQFDGHTPDSVTYSCILRACASTEAAERGREIHEEIDNQGLIGDNIVLDNALIEMYAKCGALSKARQVLDDLPVRDAGCWTTIIGGYAEHGGEEQALSYFERMRGEGFLPNVATYSSVLKACGRMQALEKGEQIHHEIATQGLLRDYYVLGNALIYMYVKCDALGRARQVLEELQLHDVVSWTALIAGYAKHGDGEQALDCFRKMQDVGLLPDAVTYTSILKACGSIKAVETGEQIHNEIAHKALMLNNTVLGSALVDMYAKCGALTKAQRVLEELPVQNVISWTALIVGYIEHGEAEQALYCFKQMQCEGVAPNAVTFACILKACGSIGAAEKGGRIHEEIAKQGLLGKNMVLGNALVDMYAKCSALVKAREILEELPVREVISWNTIIAGYADHGEAQKALDCLERMLHDGLTPDAVTYSCILKACAASIRAAHKGEVVLDQIAKEGLLRNDTVLRNVLIDLYAKCGAFAKARQVLLAEVPLWNTISWTTLMSGYAKHGEVGEALDCFEWMQHEGLHHMHSSLRLASCKPVLA